MAAASHHFGPIRLIGSMLLMGLLFFTPGCSTGRTPVPVGVVPSGAYVSAEDEAYGHQVLATLNREYPMSRDDAAIERVRGLVMRLAKAANADHNPWNVFVLEGDSVVNAAATRGNYVFVWTGMLRAAPDDGELATVIAHELGHVLANHTKPTPAEEASHIMAQATGEIAGRIVASQPGYAPLAQITGILVTELIKAIVVNPASQSLEAEADQIGFFLMADAGFDPNNALSLWSKMASMDGSFGAGLQFLSSHPPSDERLERLRTLLPEALERYRRTQAPLKKPKPAGKKKSSKGSTTQQEPTQLEPHDSESDDSFAL
jgi:predicted Zn-dependent protease